MPISNPKLSVYKEKILDGDIHPLILSIIMDDLFKQDWLTFEPETMWLEIEELFNIDMNSIPQQNLDKINAVKLHRLMPSIYYNEGLFDNVCTCFNNIPCDPEFIQEASFIDIIIGYQILLEIEDYYKLNWKEKGHYLDDCIKGYIADALVDDGFLVCPLDDMEVQEYMEELMTKTQKNSVAELKKEWEKFKNSEYIFKGLSFDRRDFIHNQIELMQLSLQSINQVINENKQEVKDFLKLKDSFSIDNPSQDKK